MAAFVVKNLPAQSWKCVRLCYGVFITGLGEMRVGSHCPGEVGTPAEVAEDPPLRWPWWAQARSPGSEAASAGSPETWPSGLPGEQAGNELRTRYVQGMYVRTRAVGEGNALSFQRPGPVYFMARVSETVTTRGRTVIPVNSLLALTHQVRTEKTLNVRVKLAITHCRKPGAQPQH